MVRSSQELQESFPFGRITTACIAIGAPGQGICGVGLGKAPLALRSRDVRLHASGCFVVGDRQTEMN